jgi:hypothetical protein
MFWIPVAPFHSWCVAIYSRRTKLGIVKSRDIESLDSHTSFLFGKINFRLMQININQNQRLSKLTKLSIFAMPTNILAGWADVGVFNDDDRDSLGIPQAQHLGPALSSISE